MRDVNVKYNFWCEGGLFSCIPARYVLTIMCFLALFLEFLTKICISVIIVAMVKTNPHESPQNYSSVTLSTEKLDVCPGVPETPSLSKHNGEFDWDEELQGYILSATGYGVIATNILGGRLSEIIGSKFVLGPGLLLTGLLTMLCPSAARWHVGAFITVRVILGITSGVIMPAINVLIARWYQVEERQLITSIIMSSIPLSTVVALSTSGLLANVAGWPSVFYLFGGLPIIWFIPWLLLAYDNPENHPRISEEEKNLIMNSLGRHKNNQASLAVPWIAILTSLPLWAYIIMSLGYSWVSTTLISELPTYLSRILHFNLQKSGVVSAMPFLFAPIGGMFFGLLSLKIRSCGYLSYFNSVRLFNTISAVGTSLFIFIITLVGCDATAIIVLLICSMVAVGAYCGGSLTNHLDLGSNFAGTTSGISGTISSISSVISPLIVGALTNGNQTLTQWHIVFYIAISFTLFAYVFFMIFGSVEEQPWNKIGTEHHESHTSENLSKKLEGSLLSNQTYIYLGSGRINEEEEAGLVVWGHLNGKYKATKTISVMYLLAQLTTILGIPAVTVPEYLIWGGRGGLFSCVPARYMIAAMCFFAVFLEYAVKVCMSVVIVAMVKRVAQEKLHTFNSTTTMATKQDDVCPGEINTESTSEINGEFDWDEQLQGYILGATSYGILITHVLGGRLSEKFGSKYVLLPSLLLAGLFTVLCPIFARWHVAAFISIRVLVGISSGVIFPSIQVLISRWYTIEERQFISSIIYSSVHICTVTTLSISGIISDGMGWPYVFYLIGGLTIFWIIPWLLLVYDSPKNHPRISEEEKNLIMNSLGQHKKNKVSYAVPWLAILTSVPVWAHIVFAFGYAWVSATLVSELPTYLSTILHFNVKESGFTSAVPFIFHPIGGIFFGYLGQKVRLSGYISSLNSMRLFNTICGVLSPILLFMITLVGCDAMATVVFLCCSQLAISAYYGGSLVNNLDLASNFAGTISGISITIVGVASVATPLIVGALTNNNQTLTQWHIVFYISISITLFSYVIFTIFGSVEEQPWNKVETKNRESQTSENISKNLEDV